jgi:hypothetical protein
MHFQPKLDYVRSFMYEVVRANCNSQSVFLQFGALTKCKISTCGIEKFAVKIS